MKLTLADLRAQCPDIPEPVLNEYLARLDENCFAVFSLPQMQAHLYALERLRPEHPVEVIFEPGLEGQTACTVLAFDYPAEFSLITGVLSAMGFDILSGDVFTSARAKAEASRRRRSNRIKTIYIDPGNPWQNGFAESFHGRFRDECLNREQLWTLTEGSPCDD